MLQGRSDLGLLQEALQALLIGGECLGKHLECDQPVETGVSREIDFPHSAGAQARLDVVVPEGLPDHIFRNSFRRYIQKSMSQ